MWIENAERKTYAMCCHLFLPEKADHPLNMIAKQFGLSHYGNASSSVARFDRQINKIHI